MILPDRMFVADWLRDTRLRRLPAHVQLLLLFLRHLCDRNGRFEFNPALIHMALYASAEVSNVSARDVEAWLEILRSGGYIKSYVGAAGRRVGEVAREYWRQKLSYGKDVYEPEQDQPELLLPVVADDPPQKKIRKSGGAGKTPPHFTSLRFDSPAPAALTLEELQKLHPHLDVEAEARAAERRQRKVHGPDYQLDLRWFAEHWLAKAGPKLVRGKTTATAEPPGWRATLDALRPGNTYEGTFAALPADLRAEIENHGRAA